MQTLNISLPEPLKQFVDEQVAQGSYSSVSEYIRDLIRAEEKRKAENELEAYLLEGLESGPATPVDANFWADVKKRGLGRFEARRQKKASAGR